MTLQRPADSKPNRWLSSYNLYSAKPENIGCEYFLLKPDAIENIWLKWQLTSAPPYRQAHDKVMSDKLLSHGVMIPQLFVVKIRLPTVGLQAAVYHRTTVTGVRCFKSSDTTRLTEVD